MPKVSSWINGQPFDFDFKIDNNGNNEKKALPTKTEKKNYIEVVL